MDIDMSSRFVRFGSLIENDKPEASAPEVAADSSLQDQIVAAIRTVYDPEIPVNIYDLGLIYEIDIDSDQFVDVKMTLTAPGCPVAGILPGQVEQTVRSVEGVKDARVELVWEPAWTKDRMTEEAKLELGMF